MPGPARFWPALCDALELEGLNHIGVISRARYDEAAPRTHRAATIHPPTRAVVVVGSAGRLHWTRFLDYIGDDPVRRLAQTAHPLDNFCQAVFRRMEGLLAGCRVLHPHEDAPITLNFLRLGELAGLGCPSELGLLVSSRWGPWFGLRAAVFSPEELPDSGLDRRMCDGCPAPCRTACPPALVGPWAFPWDRCVAERRAMGSPCAARCAAREGCRVAPERMYSDLQRLYHYDRRAGRQALCRLFGVTDEVGRNEEPMGAEVASRRPREA